MTIKHPLNWPGSAELLFIIILFLSLNAFAEPLIQAGFDNGADGFSYQDDSFRGTSAPAYADGSWNPTEAALQIDLGGIDKSDIFGMSGGWQRDFELGGLSEVTLSFRYNLTQSPFYEDNELSQILISLDGVLIGVSPNDHIDQISGNGNGGPDETTGWQQVELTLGSLTAGSHRLILGGYNNQKTAANELTRIQLDDLLLRTTSSNQPPTAVASATPDNGVAPLEVSFSSAGSTDADGSIQSYSWVFGDGGSATDANPSHSYTSPGSYTATLTVTDDQGGTGSASVTISVSDVPDTEAPGTPAGLSASANGPATINLSWSAAIDNVGVTGYRIFRDETEIATATTTSYSDSGLDPETTYSYSVTAYDAAGNESAPGEAAEATTGALPVLSSLSLSLSPASAALSVGMSQQFTASGLDQYDNAIATSPVWSVSGGGTIDQTGRFTASSAGGPFTVLADDGGISASATVTITQNTTLIETGFDSDSDGFSYVDDAYRGTSAPGFADGSHQPAGGFSGGGLEVVLGGINGDDIFGMSGGWQRDFELGGLSEVTLSFRYNLTQSPFYEDNELSQILISLDGVLIGVSPNDHIDQISGNGNGGPDETTGWQQVELTLGSLTAGSHRLILGGYNNQKTAANELTRIQFDDLLLTTGDGSVGGGGGGGQPIDGDLVVISANDLGMHCADLDYQVFSILPPFNVVHAQVVKKGVEGQPPEILDDTQLELTYVATSSANDPVGAGSINTTSQNGEVYKSNFWEIQDANTLAYGGYGTLYPFDNGLSILSGFEHLPPDLGLPVPDLMELALGNLVVHQQAMPGISDPYNANQPQAFKRFDRDLPLFAGLPFGSTIEGVNWFAADGIPLLPIDDQGRSNAYPLMTITAVDKATGEDLASTDIVVPVASEADCVNCHGTTDDGYSGVAADFASVSFDYVSQALNDGEVPGPEKHNNAAKINILRLHDTKHGTDLDNQRPVQCSQCHYSPALDLAQQGPVDDDPESGGRQQTSHVSMSRAMHQHHGELMFADEPLFPQMPLPGERTLDEAADVLQATCYQCHPGKNTQCLRGAMAAGGVVCQDCHGSMVQVGDDFTENLPHTPYPEGADSSKRVPWGSEPGCGSCHTGDALNPNHEGEGLIVAPDGIRLLQAYRSDDITAEPIRSPASRFTENQPLYRLSTGHGGVMCEGCHGSTHAIFPNPMPNANDNVTATQLQGHSGTIIECETCHEPGSLPMTLGGPHGMHNRGDMRWTDHEHKEFFKDDPDACRSCHGADLLGTVLSAAAAARHYEIEDNEIVDIARGEPIGCNLCHELPEDENED